MGTSLRVLVLTAICWGALPVSAAFSASPGDQIYTVGKYPVEAVAQSAVAAKEKAIDDGRQRAFGALLKRLIPVTAYDQIKALKSVDARSFLVSVGVRSEERSQTVYTASLDYSFSPDAVRSVLIQQSVPFVETVAPQTTLVAVYGAGNAAGDKHGPQWLRMWRDLDTQNALTPVKVAGRLPQVHADTIAAIVKGDLGGLRALAGEYQSERVVLAYAQADPAAGRVNVVLAGQDAVGVFHLAHAYKVFDGDEAYAMELAAVVGLGVLEGRWKAVHARHVPASQGGGFAVAEAVQLWVAFQSLDQWQSIRQILSETPGVSSLQVGGLSARGATVALRYPGGGEALRGALQSRGLTLAFSNGTWVIQ